MSKPVVLLLGATGLFGSLLAQRLLRERQFDLVCAGRNQETLKAFCDEFGGRYVQLDRNDEKLSSNYLMGLHPLLRLIVQALIKRMEIGHIILRKLQ